MGIKIKLLKPQKGLIIVQWEITRMLIMGDPLHHSTLGEEIFLIPYCEPGSNFSQL